MSTAGRGLPVTERPFTNQMFHTADLPATPQRDFRIPASGWHEAPEELRTLGDDIAEPVEYKRSIHGWLLWRAGPPVGTARYLAIDPNSGQSVRFDLDGKRGHGAGPDGSTHERFRTWKESLRDNPVEPS